MGLIPLFVGSWIQIFSYNSTGYVSPQEWYWLAELVFTMIFAALLLDAFLDLFFKKWRPIYFGIWILAIVLCVYWAAQYYQNTIEKMTYQPAPANMPYISQLPFLESHTRPGDLIGISGGGNIAYFIHDRTIINMDGLINSYPYYLAVKNGAGADYLYKEGMRYIFANPEVLKAPPYSGQYGGRLTIVADYGDKDLLKLSAPNP
jgi:hypothetical protein